MEPKGSLQYLQEHATGLYPKPFHTITAHLFKTHFNTVFPYAVIFPKVSRPKLCMHYSGFPCVLQAKSISSLISSP
jgi:hypothetical protein